MKVKQRKLFECIYDDDQIVEQVLKSISTYDEAGNLTGSQAFSPEGEAVQIETHTYENGKVVLSLLEDPFHETVQKSEFHYESGRIARQRDYFTEVDYIETVYTYDDQGREISIRKTDNDGIAQGYTTFEYPGDRTVEKEYNEDDQLVSIRDYQSDGHGNAIETITTQFIGKDPLITIEKANYRDKDTLSDLGRFRDDSIILEAENVFDEKGRRITTVIKDYLNPRETERAYTYDNSDRIIKEEYFDGGHLVQVREISYDAHGEVVEETYLQRLYDDYFQPMTSRFEIEYYEAVTKE